MGEAEKEAAVVLPPPRPAPPARSVAERLAEAMENIARISDFRKAYRKQFCNLSRRIKLLAPMFEELKEIKETISEQVLSTMEKLVTALDSAKDLLRLGSSGSKIFLVTISILGLSFVVVMSDDFSFQFPVYEVTSFMEIVYLFFFLFCCSRPNSVSYPP